MKIIINIDEDMLTEEELEACIKLANTDFSDVTVLPKGHGDLIDRNVAYTEFENAGCSYEGNILRFVPIVIPADK